MCKCTTPNEPRPIASFERRVEVYRRGVIRCPSLYEVENLTMMIRELFQVREAPGSKFGDILRNNSC